MENNKENYEYCKTLGLEDAMKERNSCFDENGNIINQEKLSFIMKNPNFTKYIFSKENLINNAMQDEDLSLKAAGERFLGEAFPPHWYWQMPDYYYPGLYRERFAVENSSEFSNSSDFSKLLISQTRNETVLNDCGWERKEYASLEYYNPNFPNLKMVFSKDSEDVSFVSINPNTQEEVSRFSIPFYLLCGMFLKCRELEFKKPWQLRAHDYGVVAPLVFEVDHHIVRDENTHEITDYGDWTPKDSNTQE